MPYPDNFKLTPQPDAKLMSWQDFQNQQPDNTVASPSLSYKRMEQYWDVIEAVRGGTSKIRELGQAYLPQEPGESPQGYKNRSSKVVLSPWYSRLVRGLVGMVLRKPIRLDDDSMSEATKKLLDEHLDDVNLSGDNLQTFAKDVFEAAIDYNYSGILVEYPRTDNVETQADEQALGIRPYWVLYSARDILGVRWQQFGGQKLVTQVRLRQNIVEPEGEFGEQEVEQILVYDLIDTPDGRQTAWRIFREQESQGGKPVWVVVDQGSLSLSEIPFTICYTDKKCRLEMPPPMLEVAHLNLKHFQLSADLDHALHIASVPRLFFFGVDASELGDLTTIDEGVCIPRSDARGEWLSAKIESFQSLQSRISEVEGQMAALGMSTLVSQKNVGESAEAKRLDRTQGDSIMAVVAQSLQNSLNMALYFHLQYLGIDEEASCIVSRDFDLTQMDPQMISALYQIRQGGDLSRETFLELLKQGEIGLSDDFDPQEEMDKIDAAKQEQMQSMLPTDLADFMPMQNGNGQGAQNNQNGRNNPDVVNGSATPVGQN